MTKVLVSGDVKVRLLSFGHSTLYIGHSRHEFNQAAIFLSETVFSIPNDEWVYIDTYGQSQIFRLSLTGMHKVNQIWVHRYIQESETCKVRIEQNFENRVWVLQARTQ